MHIKTLEIAGFKSFVDKTVIHFDHDVIGVVGPNGCGKSNIVDAIRWCMGEQSAKHLRGKAMEDVIFNGSDSRAATGLAEVTLTFDNTDPEYAASLPPEYRDYPEIAITRRLFRDGTSEYLINRTQVRLRDITELFLGTGVGTKAYSIVEQGRIGQIVSARPEDRRLFIEEAAGVTKYKQRRKQAERKMDLTRQNLLRITDIVSEIDRTRSTLKRQVAKAERYILYRQELEDLALHEASHKLLELIVVERVEAESRAERRELSAAARARLGEAESELDAAREEALSIETRSDECARSAFEADNEVSSLAAEIERARDRLGHFSERIDVDQRELEMNGVRLNGLNGEQAELQERLHDLTRDEQARVADAAAEDQALAELSHGEEQANLEVQALRANVAEIGSRSAAAEARIDASVQRIEETRGRRDRLVGERDALENELSNLAAQRGALERSVLELAEGKRLTADEKAALEQELESLRPRQLESERRLDNAKNELGLCRNRLRALEDLHRRLEGVGGGVRALLSRDDPRVIGLVADRIEAPEELTQAFAGLLGERLQCVVVADLDHGLDLLEALRKSERGRASIVAQNPSFVAGGRRPLLSGDADVLGYLADRLNYAPSDEALVYALVGDALLVKDQAAALRVARQHPGVTAVSLDGTVALPGGVVSGGSGDDVAAGMVEQKREMRTLSEQVERLGAEHERLAAEHNLLRTRMTEVGTALDRARQGAHEGELAHMTAEKDLARVSSELEQLTLRRSGLEREIAEADQSLTAASQAERSGRDELDELRANLGQAQHTLNRAEEGAQSWKERVAAQSALVTERKVRLAQVKEQVEGASSALERVSAAIAELSTRAERLDQELSESFAGFGETAARLVLAREARQLATARARDVHRRLDESRSLLEQVRHALATRDNELRVLREELTLLEEAVQKHEMALQRIQLERDHLLSNVKERFRGLDLPRVVGDYHARPAPDAEHRRRIEELTQLIDRMGPVNLDAQAEYADAEKRFHDLNDQKVDIEKALEELERAIKHMNRESRRRFKETFDSVNELFKKTFVRLFRGGRAELRLTDPEDLLGSGVEIIAQPPGKKLGNIELMSGGEKALTAVSLIFAMFLHRPSPFCVLDEVDAPLDEANVARYNEAIRSMTKNSQFILITHIKKTMQTVDVLYGVTMGEPGVSRIVSVKVNEKAVNRSDARGAGGVRDTRPVEEQNSGATQVA